MKVREKRSPLALTIYVARDRKIIIQLPIQKSGSRTELLVNKGLEKRSIRN
jgi:hypothetical protein